MLNEYVKKENGISFYNAEVFVDGVLLSSWSRDSQAHANQALKRLIARQKVGT